MVNNCESIMRVRMSTRDLYYGGEVVNGARNLTLCGEVCNRVMIKSSGSEGRCTGFKSIRLLAPVHAGDFIEMIAKVIEVEGETRTIHCRGFKIAQDPKNPDHVSALDVLEEPVLAHEFIAYYEPLK